MNRSPNDPKEFAFVDGDAPPSTTTIVGFSLNGISRITIFSPESNQQPVTLQH